MKLKLSYTVNDKLFERVISRLDRYIDRAYPKGKFILRVDDKAHNSPKIRVELSPDLESESGDSGADYYIDLNTQDTTFEQIQDCLILEIKKVFQRFKGIVTQDHKSFFKVEVSKKPEQDVPQELETEFDVSLAQLANYLKQNQLDDAITFIVEHYLHFNLCTWRVLAAKLILLDVPVQVLEDFKQKFTWEEDAKFQRWFERQVGDNIGKYIRKVTELKPLYYLIEYDLTKVKAWLTSEFKAAPKTSWEWAWGM